MDEVNVKSNKLLGQGTYGCIFYPEITCSGTVGKSKKLISKLQIDGHVSENEIQIGNIVKKINNYKDFFAPVISTCPINVSKIKSDITECDALKGKENLVLMKMDYIKHVDLYDYLENNMFFFKRYFTSFEYLILAIQKLVENKIIHYDMHFGNIVINTSTKLPIIFDFGLSIYEPNINIKNLSKNFFKLAPDFSIWCLEIQLINFFATIQENPITLMQLKTIVNEYVDNCKAFTIFTKSFKDNYIISAISFFEKYIGVKKEEVVKDLLSFYQTWDQYSLCLNYIKLTKNKDIDIKNEFVNRLFKILVMNINPNPTKRYSIKQTIEEFNNLKKTKSVKQYGFGVHQ